jgi:hypothetical protein
MDSVSMRVPWVRSIAAPVCGLERKVGRVLHLHHAVEGAGAFIVAEFHAQ